MSEPANRTGVKTSEFKFVLWAGTLAPILAAAAGFLPAQWAALCVALSTAAYSLSRGMAKATLPPPVVSHGPPVVGPRAVERRGPDDP